MIMNGNEEEQQQINMNCLPWQQRERVPSQKINVILLPHTVYIGVFVCSFQRVKTFSLAENQNKQECRVAVGIEMGGIQAFRED